MEVTPSSYCYFNSANENTVSTTEEFEQSTTVAAPADSIFDFISDVNEGISKTLESSKHLGEGKGGKEAIEANK